VRRYGALVRGSPQEEQLSVNLQALYQALCVPIVQELEGKGSKDKRGWVQIILSGEAERMMILWMMWQGR
jgi:hypothetical protein